METEISETEQLYVTAIVSLLEANGSLLLSDLGGLIAKTVDPKIRAEIKSLKGIVSKHEDIFKVLGKGPKLKVRLAGSKPVTKKPEILPNIKPMPAEIPSISQKNEISSALTADEALKGYTNQLQKHLKSGKWNEVAKLLKVRSSPISAQLGQLLKNNVVSTQNSARNFDSGVNKLLSKLPTELQIDWTNLVRNHLLTCVFYYGSNYREAAKSQIDVLDCFEDYWKAVGVAQLQPPALQVWRVAVIESRLIAIWAHLSLEKSGEESTVLVDIQTKLRSYTRLVEKNAGLLILQNTMVRIYSHCNTTSNFGTTLKVAQNISITTENFPVSDVVNWNFFIGRYHLYKGEYPKAHSLLKSAFERCSKKYAKNKQTILTYLLPVQAMMGVYPKIKLLDQYKLDHFYEILEGVKRGNYTQYEQALDKFQSSFDRGVYLPLRKLSSTLFRNLFNRTARILGSLQTPPVAYPSQIKLAALHAALNFSGYPASIAETECIVINLIASKKIRGYISHQHKLVVLASSEQFPLLYPK